MTGQARTLLIISLTELNGIKHKVTKEKINGLVLAIQHFNNKEYENMKDQKHVEETYETKIKKLTI